MKDYHGVYATIVPLPVDHERLYLAYGIRLLSCVSVPRKDGSAGPYALTLAAPANFDLSTLYIIDALNDYYRTLSQDVHVTHCVSVGHWFEEV